MTSHPMQNVRTAPPALVWLPLLGAVALGAAAGVGLWPAVGAGVGLCGALLALAVPQYVLLALVLGRAAIDAFAESHIVPAGALDIRGTFLINAVLVGTALLMASRKLAAPETGFLPRPLRLLVLFSAWVWLSTLWSIDASETWHEAFRLCATVAAGYIAANAVWADVRWAERLAVATVVAMVAPACVAVYQAATGTGNTLEGINRAFGTLRHPNDFAIFSAFVGIVAINLLLSARAAGRRAWPFAGATLLVVTGSFFAYARSALISLIIGGMVSIWMRRGGSGLRLRRLAGVGVILGVLLVPFAGTLRSRFSEDQERLASWSVRDVRNPALLSPMQFRLYVWSLAGDMFVRAPVVGNGWGSFSRYFASLLTPDIQLEPQNPHNDYLRVASETGVVGLGFFAVAVVSALVSGMRARKAGLGGMWPATLVGLMAAYLACSLTINVFASTAPPFYLWVVSGSALAAIARELSDQRVRRGPVKNG
jgi:O-antigen ligase